MPSLGNAFGNNFDPIPLFDGATTGLQTVTLQATFDETLRILCEGEPIEAIANRFQRQMPLEEHHQQQVRSYNSMFEPLPFFDFVSPRAISKNSPHYQAHRHQKIPEVRQKEGAGRATNSSILSADQKRKLTNVQDELVNPKAKRQRHQLVDEYSTSRFRTFHLDQWDVKFGELLEYKKIYGDCNVPIAFSENLQLARWVKRQRYQYKLKNEGTSSTMTQRRITELEKAGFVWDLHNLAWEDKFWELMQYEKKFGNCIVPTHYKPNKKLAAWVKCQRRQYKIYLDCSEDSTMTKERFLKLDKIGFIWEVRSSEKAYS